jgi:hypothetical protein
LFPNLIAVFVKNVLEFRGVKIGVDDGSIVQIELGLKAVTRLY